MIMKVKTEMEIVPGFVSTLCLPSYEGPLIKQFGKCPFQLLIGMKILFSDISFDTGGWGDLNSDYCLTDSTGFAKNELCIPRNP